jgi:hypothetical protein
MTLVEMIIDKTNNIRVLNNLDVGKEVINPLMDELLAFLMESYKDNMPKGELPAKFFYSKHELTKEYLDGVEPSYIPLVVLRACIGKDSPEIQHDTMELTNWKPFINMYADAIPRPEGN